MGTCLSSQFTFPLTGAFSFFRGCSIWMLSKAFIHSSVTDSPSKMCTTQHNVGLGIHLLFLQCLIVYLLIYFVCCKKVRGLQSCAFTFYFLIGYHYTHHSLKKNLSAKLVRSHGLCNFASPVASDGTFWWLIWNILRSFLSSTVICRLIVLHLPP